MAIHLRQLGLEDMDEAARVHRMSFDHALPELDGLHTPEEDRDYFRRAVFESCEIWGAVEEHLVGFVAFGNGWIEQLYVLPDWHGQGLGRTLLDVAKAKWPRLTLWTFQQNGPARLFYERNGFVPVEETGGLGNEAKAPDVRYEWHRDGLTEPSLRSRLL